MLWTRLVLLLAALLAFAALPHLGEARPSVFDRLATVTNGASLSVFPEKIGLDTTSVTVRWSGVKNPAETDAIIIYIAAIDTKKDHTLGYYPMSMAEGWQTGSGLITVPVFHPRDHGYYFELVDKSLQTLATSEVVPAAEPGLASQLHLSLTHNTSTMALMYTTGAAASVEHSLQFSPSPFPSSRSSAGLVLGAGAWHSAWQRAGKYVPRAALSTWVGAEVEPSEAAELLAVRTVPAEHYKTYTITDMCAEPASKKKNFLAPGNFRLAMLTELAPATRYWYRVVDSAGKVISATSSFVSPRPVGRNSEADIIAFGDMGTSVEWFTESVMQIDAAGTVRALTAAVDALGDRPVTVLHVGDLAYANGKGRIWDLFMRNIEPVAARVPWMVSFGNHESIYTGQPFMPKWADYENDSGGECSVPAARRFFMPPNFTPLPYAAPMRFDTEQLAMREEGEDDYTDMRNVAYSFETGPVHVLIFSSEHNFLPGSKQYQFISRDLGSVDRTRTPWVVVAAHRPMYCSIEGCSVSSKNLKGTIIDKLRETFENVYKQFNVDVGLYGHFHNYERSCQMRANFDCVAREGSEFAAGKGPIHVVVGMAGNAHNSNWANFYPKSPLATKLDTHQQPDWVIFRSMGIGYTHIHANGTHFDFSFIGSASRRVHDHFTLIR